MTNQQPGRESDQFALRLPDGMRDRIKAAAAGNKRSMNAEIVATLEKEYPAALSIDEIAADLKEDIEHFESMIANRPEMSSGAYRFGLRDFKRLSERFSEMLREEEKAVEAYLSKLRGEKK